LTRVTIGGFVKLLAFHHRRYKFEWALFFYQLPSAVFIQQHRNFGTEDGGEFAFKLLFCHIGTSFLRFQTNEITIWTIKKSTIIGWEPLSFTSGEAPQVREEFENQD
jgi:hypothetical protein